MNHKIVMSIGGSDPSTGAGIQTDLKSLTLLDIHPTTIITSITVQNTQQVKKIHPLPVKLIEEQIDHIMNDFEINYIKTGLLFNQEIADMVSKKIRQYNFKAVIDPVLISTTKDSLSSNDLKNSIIKNLIPNSYILTPNLNEASNLSKIKINSLLDMKKAGKILYDLGAKHVLIKGGHQTSDKAIDIFYDGTSFQQISLPKIPDKQAHGSGCNLSALITGYLALGNKPKLAVKKAKHVLWQMIKEGYIPGKGVDVLSVKQHSLKNAPPLDIDEKHFEIWQNLYDSLQLIIKILPREFIPEVGINIGYALENATDYNDICSLNGRIIKDKHDPILCGSLTFGGSKHVASIILGALKKYPYLRSAMNIKYNSEILNACEKAELKISTFNRKNEPKETTSSMEWGTIEALNKSVDIIYDKGSIGKEPMIRIIGKNPNDIHKKLSLIIKKYNV